MVATQRRASPVVAAAARPEVKRPRVAIMHDWIVEPGGAELVLKSLIGMFPDADVFCMVDRMRDAERSALGLTRTRTSLLQHVPTVARNYRLLVPLMPAALYTIDVSAYDLILSNSHAVAKGVHTTPEQLHLCYCLSPMRYAWDLRDSYLRESGLDGGMSGPLARFVLERLRRWDATTTPRVAAFATLSHFIADRIRRNYGREARVIYPPVDTDFFTPGGERGDYYVTASRLVQYKRIDLIARAFAQLPAQRLLIVGDGPDEVKVRAGAGSNVTMLGRRSRVELRDLVRGARAFLFAAEEDFGIAPVEAQACDTPVIAFGRGGAVETICGASHSAPTGLFFDEQTPESLAAAIRRFEGAGSEIPLGRCRANALRFRAPLFEEGMRSFVGRAWTAFAERRHGSTRMGPGGVEPPHVGL